MGNIMLVVVVVDWLRLVSAKLLLHMCSLHHQVFGDSVVVLRWPVLSFFPVRRAHDTFGGWCARRASSSEVLRS
jgi:hypothetical protein